MLSRRANAKEAFDKARADLVRKQLSEMPLGRLRETTDGRVRLGLIEAAGFATVGQAVEAGRSRLEQIGGVGAHSATQVIAAARQLQLTLAENTRLRLDPVGRSRTQTALLEALWGHEVTKGAMEPIQGDLVALTSSIERLSRTAARSTSRVRMFFAGAVERREARNALTEIESLLGAAATLTLRQTLQAGLAVAQAAVRPPDPSCPVADGMLWTTPAPVGRRVGEHRVRRCSAPWLRRRSPTKPAPPPHGSTSENADRIRPQGGSAARRPPRSLSGAPPGRPRRTGSRPAFREATPG